MLFRSAENPNKLVSAYKDNVAFNAGPTVEQFAPLSADKPDYFSIKKIDTVLSLKAETHNFPTTVELFNGADGLFSARRIRSEEFSTPVGNVIPPIDS